MPSRHILFLFDAPIGGRTQMLLPNDSNVVVNSSSTLEKDNLKDFDKNAVEVICSATKGESVNTTKPSLFLQYLAKGLAGDAFLQNVEILSANELCSYLQRHVLEETAGQQTVSYEKLGFGTGKFLFWKTATPPKMPLQQLTHTRSQDSMNFVSLDNSDLHSSSVLSDEAYLSFPTNTTPTTPPHSSTITPSINIPLSLQPFTSNNNNNNNNNNISAIIPELSQDTNDMLGRLMEAERQTQLSEEPVAIAILCSAPLSASQELFDEDREAILESFADTQKRLQARVEYATEHSIRRLVTAEELDIIHFADYSPRRADSKNIFIEAPNGEAVEMTINNFAQLFTHGLFSSQNSSLVSSSEFGMIQPPKLVVVTGESADLLAEAFLQVNAKCVVALRSVSLNTQAATQTFLSIFYPFLMDGKSVSSSFQTALDNAKREMADPSIDLTHLFRVCTHDYQVLREPLFPGISEGQLDLLTTLSTAKNLPSGSNFIPREDANKICRALLSPDVRMCYAYGSIGCGKTTVGIQVAKFLASRRRFVDGVLWLDLNNQRFNQFIFSLGRILQINNNNQEDLLAKLGLLQHEALLILDHADFTHTAYEKALFEEFLKDLVKVTRNLKILLLASQPPRQPLEGTKVIEIGELSISESSALLSSLSPNLAPDAAKISARVEKNPLALQMIAHLISHPIFSNLSGEKLLEMLQEPLYPKNENQSAVVEAFALPQARNRRLRSTTTGARTLSSSAPVSSPAFALASESSSSSSLSNNGSATNFPSSPNYVSPNYVSPQTHGLSGSGLNNSSLNFSRVKDELFPFPRSQSMSQESFETHRSSLGISQELEESNFLSQDEGSGRPASTQIPSAVFEDNQMHIEKESMSRDNRPQSERFRKAQAGTKSKKKTLQASTQLDHSARERSLRSSSNSESVHFTLPTGFLADQQHQAGFFSSTSAASTSTTASSKESSQRVSQEMPFLGPQDESSDKGDVEESSEDADVPKMSPKIMKARARARTKSKRKQRAASPPPLQRLSSSAPDSSTPNHLKEMNNSGTALSSSSSFDHSEVAGMGDERIFSPLGASFDSVSSPGLSGSASSPFFASTSLRDMAPESAMSPDVYLHSSSNSSTDAPTPEPFFYSMDENAGTPVMGNNVLSEEEAEEGKEGQKMAHERARPSSDTARRATSAGRAKALQAQKKLSMPSEALQEESHPSPVVFSQPASRVMYLSPRRSEGMEPVFGVSKSLKTQPYERASTVPPVGARFANIFPAVVDLCVSALPQNTLPFLIALTLFPGQFSLDAAVNLFDQERNVTRKLLRSFIHLQLIAGSSQRYFMHELVRDCLQKKLQEYPPDFLRVYQARFIEYYKKLLSHCNDHYDQGNQIGTTIFDQEHQNFELAMELSQNFFPLQYVELSLAGSSVFSARYPSKERVAIYQKCLQYTTEFPELESKIRIFLGMSLERIGEFDASLMHYNTALKKFKTLKGPRCEEVATIHKNLGLLFANHYFKKRNLETAQDYLKKALDLRIELLGMSHPETAQSYSHMATLKRRLKQYDEAETLYKKALDILQNIMGKNNVSVARVISNLGKLYSLVGRAEESESSYLKAIRIWRKLKHPDLCGSLINLASLYADQKKYSHAELLLREAYELRLHESPLDLATVLSKLGSVLMEQSKLDKAAVSLEDSLKLRFENSGPQHFLFKQDFQLLKTCLEKLNDPEGLERIERTFNRASWKKQPMKRHPVRKFQNRTWTPNSPNVNNNNNFLTNSGNYNNTANYPQNTTNFHQHQPRYPTRSSNRSASFTKRRQ